MGILDLEGHLIFYRSYHFNHVNVSIHLCCIPIILFSTLAFLSPVNILGKEYPYANLGSVLAWSYGIYYSILDWQLGIPSMALLGTCLLYTSDAADDMQCVDLGCRRIIKKKKKKNEFFFFKQKTAYFFFSSRRRHTR